MSRYNVVIVDGLADDFQADADLGSRIIDAVDGDGRSMPDPIDDGVCETASARA